MEAAEVKRHASLRNERKDRFYTGASAAHEAIEHVIDATGRLILYLLDLEEPDAKRDCLAALDQARSWALTAQFERLDLFSRWSLCMRLHMQAQTLVCWTGEPRLGSLSSYPIDIGYRLYTHQHHWLRLCRICLECSALTEK